jgi:hypothetical protein
MAPVPVHVGERVPRPALHPEGVVAGVVHVDVVGIAVLVEGLRGGVVIEVAQRVVLVIPAQLELQLLGDLVRVVRREPVVRGLPVQEVVEDVPLVRRRRRIVTVPEECQIVERRVPVRSRVGPDVVEVEPPRRPVENMLARNS